MLDCIAAAYGRRQGSHPGQVGSSSQGQRRKTNNHLHSWPISPFQPGEGPRKAQGEHAESTQKGLRQPIGPQNSHFRNAWTVPKLPISRFFLVLLLTALANKKSDAEGGRRDALFGSNKGGPVVVLQRGQDANNLPPDRHTGEVPMWAAASERLYCPSSCPSPH